MLVHSIGFAPRGALDGRFADVTTREAWRITMDVSAYSLIGLARAFKPMMPAGSSIVTLTYYGAEKVVRNYNVMGVAKAALEASMRYLAEDLGQDGIRVNAISAGPIKTLAAAGIKGMRTMLGENADEDAAAPEHRAGRLRERRALPLLGPRAERDGRGAPRRRRPEHHGRRVDGVGVASTSSGRRASAQKRPRRRGFSPTNGFERRSSPMTPAGPVARVEPHVVAEREELLPD